MGGLTTSWAALVREGILTEKWMTLWKGHTDGSRSPLGTEDRHRDRAEAQGGTVGDGLSYAVTLVPGGLGLEGFENLLRVSSATEELEAEATESHSCKVKQSRKRP